MGKRPAITKRQVLEAAAALGVLGVGAQLGCDGVEQRGAGGSTTAGGLSGSGGGESGAGGAGTVGGAPGGGAGGGSGGEGGGSVGTALVGIARSEDVEQAVRQAVALAAGGLGFIASGQTVLLKVNVNSGDPYPYSTNPAVVAATIAMAWEEGAGRVIVADRSNPSYQPTTSAMDKAGILQAAIAAGAEVTDIGDNGYQLVTPAGADHWPAGFSIPLLLDEVDHVINLPACKDHFMANFTMCLKAWMGIIPQSDRGFAHGDLGHRLPELHLAVKASFSILDATRACLTGGPFTGGEVAEPGLVVASADPVACDVTGVAILKHYLQQKGLANGYIDAYGVWDQPQIVRAVALGLGVSGPAGYHAEASGVPEMDALMDYVG